MYSAYDSAGALPIYPSPDVSIMDSSENHTQLKCIAMEYNID
jgi:hypothetical protein